MRGDRISCHREDLEPILERGRFQAFMHGCNCQCLMGAGIARAVKRIFPQAWKADKATGKGSREKLGTIGVVEDGDRIVINAYTQYDVKGPMPRVDYNAVRSCFRAAFAEMSARGMDTITIPKIGAGLAGGDWGVIEGIILEEMPEGMRAKAYFL